MRRATTAKTNVRRNHVTYGIVHVHTTFNNTLINITDLNGNTLAFCSAGYVGYKGAKKSSPYAGQLVAEKAGLKAKECGLETVQVHVSGPGSAKELAVSAIQALFKVTLIKDTTSLPHNGCKRPKRRCV